MTQNMDDKDMILDVIQDNNRLNELKITFNLFDKDRDKYVDSEDLGNIMKSLGYELSETELEDMIHDVCKEDNKEKINFEQFNAVMNKRGQEADIVEEYTEAFRVFDREGKGVVNKDEMRQILVTLGHDVTATEIDYMLRDADVYGDGVIEYRKFVRLMLFK
jgi:Ca2+-binding EF-hand superfamily protein